MSRKSVLVLALCMHVLSMHAVCILAIFLQLVICILENLFDRSVAIISSVKLSANGELDFEVLLMPEKRKLKHVILWLAQQAGKIKRILCCDRLPEKARCIRAL